MSQGGWIRSGGRGVQTVHNTSKSLIINFTQRSYYVARLFVPFSQHSSRGQYILQSEKVDFLATEDIFKWLCI